MISEQEELNDLLAEYPEGVKCESCHDTIDNPTVDNMVWRYYPGTWETPPEQELELVCSDCLKDVDWE